jgi:hypothetical protein
MKIAIRSGLVLLTLALLIPSSPALAQQGRSIRDTAKADQKDNRDKDKKDKKDPIQVPEPATLLLLATMAGVAGARKLWQKRVI